MKILILSETLAGSGHAVAAQNIAKGIRTFYPDAEIKLDTGLPKVSPTLEKLSGKLYMKTIQYASPLWGWAYKREKEWSLIWKRVLQNVVAARLESYIQTERPDIVIVTHAFCLGGLSKIKNTHRFRLGAALTDFCVHNFWVFDEVDYYFVGSESIKQRMTEEYRVPSSKIHVTGIPIDPVFNQNLNRSSLRKKLNIPEEATLLLVSGGGLGMAPFKEIVGALKTVQNSLYIVVILGRNKRSRSEMEQVAASYPHTIRLLDFVDNMEEWMSAADLLIGKPGGLTVSEALSCNLPLIIYQPIPGQEERNSQFLLENKIAMKADNREQLSRIVEQHLQDFSFIEAIRKRIQHQQHPAAAIDVGKIILS